MAFSGIAVTEALSLENPQPIEPSAYRALSLENPQLFWRAPSLQIKSTVKAGMLTKATSQKTSGHSIIQ